eukprot:scaffold253501_cov43-Prasinocladus_malaysianus.AAC.2
MWSDHHQEGISRGRQAHHDAPLSDHTSSPHQWQSEERLMDVILDDSKSGELSEQQRRHTTDDRASILSTSPSWGSDDFVDIDLHTEDDPTWDAFASSELANEDMLGSLQLMLSLMDEQIIAPYNRALDDRERMQDRSLASP